MSGPAGAAATLVLVVLAGCSLFLVPEREPRDGGTSPQPSDIASMHPSASVVQAIPDPLNPIPHAAGDVVPVPGGTISYVGLSEIDGRLVAAFATSGTVPAGATLLVVGSPEVALVVTGDQLLSEPFGDSSTPPSHDEVLTVRIGDLLIPFLAGGGP